ncbi:MAG: hypothetical protein QF519_05050, partial [Candidatus Poseidoniia archaeon]|nr:hypothetical protein [Candidatus Poseidoniia archaeon]
KDKTLYARSPSASRRAGRCKQTTVLETGTNIEYMPATTSPLHALSTELGATFYISYYERVKVDSESGTTLDRFLDVTVYATFPDFYAAGNYGLLYLTDEEHFPSETTYTGSLFSAEAGATMAIDAIKTTSVITAMPGPDNTTVDPTTDTHLLTNTAFAVNTQMPVVDSEGNFVLDSEGNITFRTVDLNADGSLAAAATMFVDRSTHQVGDGANFSDTFPHSNTDPAAPAFFPNPFMSNYNNMYTPTDAANWSGGLAHFTGVPINATGIPMDMDYGTLYNYVEMNMVNGTPMPTGNSQQVLEPLPDSELLANGGSWIAYSFIPGMPTGPSAVPVKMSYEENIWFDPFTGTVANQMYNVTVYADIIGATLQTIDIEYSDAQKAAYPASMGQKAFAQFYSERTIPAMGINGGYTEAEQTEGVERADEVNTQLKMADTYVPGTLIVLALGCLIGGFYIYYQEGEGGGGAPAAAPEPEADDGGDSDAGDSGDDDSDGDDSGD